MRILRYFVITVLVCLTSLARGQSGFFVDKDSLIAKFEKDIIYHLIEQKQITENKIPFNLEDYKIQIIVRKCIEIHSDSHDRRLLLVRFRTSSDHTDSFWGILTNEKRYFFYDIDDTREAELSLFKKSYDLLTVSAILFYCYQHPHDEFGYWPVASYMYFKNLNIIKEALHNNPALTMSKVDSARIFLQKITGKKPEFKGNNSGRFRLTQEDYTTWLNWFEKNNSKLYWDTKNKKVRLNKN